MPVISPLADLRPTASASGLRLTSGPCSAAGPVATATAAATAAATPTTSPATVPAGTPGLATFVATSPAAPAATSAAATPIPCAIAAVIHSPTPSTIATEFLQCLPPLPPEPPLPILHPEDKTRQHSSAYSIAKLSDSVPHPLTSGQLHSDANAAWTPSCVPWPALGGFPRHRYL